jgi:hypothetical protein
MKCGDLWKMLPIPSTLKGRKLQCWIKQGTLPNTTEKAWLNVEKAAEGRKFDLGEVPHFKHWTKKNHS